MPFWTRMFKTALNNNIIPHKWKLSNTQQRHRQGHLIHPHIPPLNCKDTGEEPSSLHNTPTQHGFKILHSTVTVLHTLHNTVAKGFTQIALTARTITVELDMSKAFDTINIHTLIRQMPQTNIPGIIIKFISNEIKGRKTYATYINHTSIQRQFENGVPKGASSHPHYLTFTLQTYYHPEHMFRSWPTQIISPSHLHTQARVQPRNTYNHT